MHTDVVQKNRIYYISNTFPENLAVSHISEIQQSEREREKINSQTTKQNMVPHTYDADAKYLGQEYEYTA